MITHFNELLLSLTTPVYLHAWSNQLAHDLVYTEVTRFGKNTVAVDTEKTVKYMGNRPNLNHQEGSSLITNQYQYYNKKTL